MPEHEHTTRNIPAREPDFILPFSEKVHARGWQEGDHFVVLLELLTGEVLSYAVKQDSPVTAEQKTDAFYAIVRALADTYAKPSV